MKYELYNKPNPKYNYKQQILINRGVPESELNHYMNTTDDDINDYRLLGEDNLNAAFEIMRRSVEGRKPAIVIVDPDNDGMTSSALLLNWLWDYDKEYAENYIEYILHSGKQHGLADTFELIEAMDTVQVVWVPDAGSNDLTQLQKLSDLGKKVIILDHHEVESSPSAAANIVTINNQYSDYPNKAFSGVGVVWQFLRYCEDRLNIFPRYTDEYLDLVASGNLGDVMDLRSNETRHLILKGFEPDNIHNPFIYYMWQKNQFKLGDHITPMGAAFYIVPFVNAILRSGTQEEKHLVFDSMLNYKALNSILSNKRGHKIGEQEALVEQAIRTATNVKNRQSKSEISALDFFKNKIENDNMLENHKVLMFLVEPGQVDPNIAGLVANKIMAKYQRPTCILTAFKKDDIDYYSGSCRGCDIVGINDFKGICESTGLVEWCIGHANAFGTCIKKSAVPAFLLATDEILKDMPSEPIYRVDYIVRANEIDPQMILDIGEMGDCWGQGMPESLIAIQGLQITKDMLTMMKSNTLKIMLPNNIAMIKFNTSDEEYKQLYSENGYIEINVVAKCNCNEWCGRISPQLMLHDYEIIGRCAYVF